MDLRISEPESLILEFYRVPEDRPVIGGPLQVFLYGGRGMGKTIVLRDLAFQLEEVGETVEFVEGRNWEIGMHRIRHLANSIKSYKPHLFINDLDHLLSRLSIFNKDYENVLKDCMQLMASLPVDRKGIFVSSTLSPTRLERHLGQLPSLNRNSRTLLEAFSSFVRDFDDFQLNPWRADWQRNVKSTIDGFLYTCLGKQALITCREMLLRLTGGHPALLTWALDEVRALTKITEAKNRQLTEALNGGQSGEDVRAQLRLHLEDHLIRTGMKPLRRALSSLQNSDGLAEREAYDALGRLLRDGKSPEPVGVREILMDEGLIYKDLETGAYVIPGDLLQREILQSTSLIPEDKVPRELTSGREGELVTDRLELRIEPSTKIPDQKGRLLVRTSSGESSIDLSGGSWVILKKLFERPDEVFSLEQLILPPLNVEPAVRSAIQRLQSKLLQAGIVGVVENVYGRGYRKGTSPTQREKVLRGKEEPEEKMP